MSLREYLPSKRIGYIIIILAIIIVVFFVLKYIPNIQKTTIFSKNTIAENQQASSKIGDIVNKDTDGDGIADWEESIRGTDPSKTDTDSDGVSDFTEIEQLRAQESANNQNTPETETSIFAKQLFTTVASLQESGNLNEESASKIINQASLSAQKNVQKTFYKKEQLTISPKLTGKVFEKNTTAILVKNNVTYESLQKIFAILGTLPDTGEIEGTTIVQDLTLIDTSFKKALGELLKNPVPAQSTETYLKFLNNLQYISENISDMVLIETNPIVSFSAITVYPENISSIIEISYEMFEEYKK
jgi:hypothetical protein